MIFNRLLFTLAFSLIIVSYSSKAVAIEEIKFTKQDFKLITKKGDSAQVLVKTYNPSIGKRDLFILKYNYSIFDILPDGSYIINIHFLNAYKPKIPTPSGFDDLMVGVFPPIQIKLDKYFHIVEVVNWSETSKKIHNAIESFKKIIQK